MEGHVVGFAIVVGVGDVMDGANSHGHLTDGIDDGQVDDSPEEEGDSAERRTERKLAKAPANHKFKKRKTICYLSETISQKLALFLMWLLWI